MPTAKGTSLDTLPRALKGLKIFRGFGVPFEGSSFCFFVESPAIVMSLVRVYKRVMESSIEKGDEVLRTKTSKDLGSEIMYYLSLE